MALGPPHTSGTRAPSGASFAIASALLFGASTPAAKLLLGDLPPPQLAGLLHAGSGLGLTLIRLLMPSCAEEAALARPDAPWLGGAVLAGGVLAPVLLLRGL